MGRRLKIMAWVPKAFLLVQGVYFFMVAASFRGVDRWLSEGHPVAWWSSMPLIFAVAGAAAIALALAPRPTPALVAVSLLLIGGATLGRGFSVALGDGDIGTRFRALGWGLQWFAVVVCVTQIIGTDAIRRHHPWSS